MLKNLGEVVSGAGAEPPAAKISPTANPMPTSHSLPERGVGMLCRVMECFLSACVKLVVSPPALRQPLYNQESSRFNFISQRALHNHYTFCITVTGARG